MLIDLGYQIKKIEYEDFEERERIRKNYIAGINRGLIDRSLFDGQGGLFTDIIDEKLFVAFDNDLPVGYARIHDYVQGIDFQHFMEKHINDSCPSLVVSNIKRLNELKNIFQNRKVANLSLLEALIKNKGVGSALISRLKDDFDIIFANAYREALLFYEKNGFEKSKLNQKCCLSKCAFLSCDVDKYEPLVWKRVKK